MVTFDARWSLTSELNDSIYGKLEISDFGDCKLYLPFSFGKRIEKVLELTKYDCLYGSTNNGQTILLVNCHETSSGMRTNTVITADKAYVFNDLDALTKEYDAVLVSLDRLGVWLNSNCVDTAYKMSDAGTLESISATATPKTIWQGACNNFSIKFQCDINVKAEMANTFVIKSNYFMKLQFHETLSFSKLDQVSDVIVLIQKISDLICLCVGEDIYINSVKFVAEGSSASLHQYGMDSNCYNKKDKLNQSIDFPLISDSFNGLLSLWLENYENLIGSAKIIKNHYLDIGQRKRMIDIPTFIKDACVGIESYSRNMREIKIEDDNEIYLPRYQRIMEAVKENTADAKWLRQKLKYANEASLRKRLKILFSELATESTYIRNFLHLAEKKISDLTIDKIVKTRNFYTHYDLSSQDEAYDDMSAYNISVLLVELLRAILLKSCGLPIVIIDEAWRNNQTVLKSCANMGFITLTPLAIALVEIEISEQIFWFRSSYFQENNVTYDAFIRPLIEKNISCFITIDDYDSNKRGFYNKEKTIERFSIKLLPEEISTRKTGLLFDTIIKHREAGSNIAIWASEKHVQSGIIDIIKDQLSQEDNK